MVTIIVAVIRVLGLRKLWEWFTTTTWYIGAKMWYDSLSEPKRAYVAAGVLIALLLVIFL